MDYRVGVDIGGTFTDFCAFDEDSNTFHALKVLSTPDRPGAEVMAGLGQLQERFGVAPAAITYFTHGTTVGVNTVIQRKGIRLCLFVTENFTDVLEIARLKMPDPYNLDSTRPPPLVPKDRVIPVRERMRADGIVDTPVDEGSVIAAIGAARALGAEGIVIALINAYRNPAHEGEVKAIVAREAPELSVYCSAEVWSIIREYERTVTAVIHGYVQPRVSGYLGSLQEALRAAGVPAEPLVTKSNGGVMSAEQGKTDCAQMILSGTAAGVIGASHVARLSGFENAISFDVGGTSADVAFIREGMPQYGVGEVIGEFPIFIPTVAVTSIGAGGGSIAQVDDFGVLKVGPESAGANPGPACYGQGGKRATVTDAFAVLGFLGQAALAYNAVRIDRAKAEAAIGVLAKHIGRDVRETAQAIIEIAVSGMYMEISKLMSSYGVDPRDFALQAFGGAGPMLACFLARELGVTHVVVPTTPGVLSALGGLIADLKNDFIKTVYIDLDADAVPIMRTGFEVLSERAMHWLRHEQGYDGRHRLLYSADMRYRGQSFEIEVPLDATHLEAGDISGLAEAFHQVHERLYEHADRAAPVQMINLRLVVVGETPMPHFMTAAEVPEDAVPEREVAVHLDGAERTVPLFARVGLAPGHRFAGPAIVAQDDCTICVPDSFDGRVDAYSQIVLARRAANGEGG
jgi:N-methylhydantoinase A